MRLQVPATCRVLNDFASIGSLDLGWDPNGNLSTRGSLSYFYDYRDRLTEIRDGDDVIVSYVYDAYDRRIAKSIAGATVETVWAGSRAIEEYRDDQLSDRRTYGLGLDEIVSLEIDVNGDGSLAQTEEYIPFYDHTGNITQLTDVDGQLIERYEYSPFGERWVFVDSTPPEIEQIRTKDGEIWIEFSEEVLLGRLEKALNDGDFVLENLTRAETVDLEISQPVKTGRQAGRRLVVRIADQTQVELWEQEDVLSFQLPPPDAVEDLFQNQMVNPSSAVALEWPIVDAVHADTTAPRVELACVTAAGILELQLSEEVSVGAATAGLITVDGQAVEWNLSGDHYTLRTTEALDPGSYDVAVGLGPFDLAGLGLVSPFDVTVEVATGEGQLAWAAPYPSQVASSTVLNPYGFHGLPTDTETGFVFARRRLLDPEMGRFISTDPMGYVDGPNQYQFALNSPFNFSDPTGEIAETVWDAASLGLGLTSLYHNVRSGNYGGAVLDAVGIVIDAAATATPFVPGGAGAALKASRSTGILGKAVLVDQTLNVGQGVIQARDAAKEGDYGWAAFYGGMSALGVRGMDASPFEFRARAGTAPSGFGGVGIATRTRGYGEGRARGIPHKPLSPGDTDQYRYFSKRPGDKLEGHEIWQSANTSAHGLGGRTGTLGRRNPSIAIPSREHRKVVNAIQREMIPSPRAMTPLENINMNIIVLREAQRRGVPIGDRQIKDAAKRAVRFYERMKAAGHLR